MPSRQPSTGSRPACTTPDKKTSSHIRFLLTQSSSMFNFSAFGFSEILRTAKLHFGKSLEKKRSALLE